MRISVFIATSVDGYIARENGDLDWLPADGGVTDAVDNGYAEFIATVDVCVMGRHTFEKVLTLGPSPFAGKRVVVLTSQANGLRAPAGAEVEFIAGSPEEIVELLRAQGARHLYVDGGITIQRF